MKRKRAASLFIKAVLAGNVMKVLEGMGSTRRWVSHTSKRGLPRRLEGAVHGYTEPKSETGSCRDTDLGRCMTKSE